MRRAFTLLELLVVMAIIGVFSALLVSTLAQARAEAALVKSTSNLRQLAAGLLAYSAEHNGELLPHAVFDSSINENREWCFAYGYKNSQEGFKAGILGPYLSKAEEIIKDPTWVVPDIVEKTLKKQGKPGAVGYGYNGWYLSEKIDVVNGHWRGFSLATVQRPERTIIFATSAFFYGGRVLPSENIWSPTYDAASASIRAAKDGRALVAWLGGNVTREKIRPDPKVNRPGDPQLGWLDATAADQASGDRDLFDRE